MSFFPHKASASTGFEPVPLLELDLAVVFQQPGKLVPVLDQQWLLNLNYSPHMAVGRVILTRHQVKL